MSWECPICHNYTANGQKHNCINDERDSLLEQNRKLEARLASLDMLTEADNKVVYVSVLVAERDALREVCATLKQELAEAKSFADKQFAKLVDERDAAVKERDEYKALYESKVQQVMRFSQKADHALESVKMAEIALNKIDRHQNCRDSFEICKEAIAKLKERHGELK